MSYRRDRDGHVYYYAPEAEVRAAMRLCLRSKDQKMFEGLLMALSDHRLELERWATEELRSLSPDVQLYWNGECNCDGRQN